MPMTVEKQVDLDDISAEDATQVLKELSHEKTKVKTTADFSKVLLDTAKKRARSEIEKTGKYDHKVDGMVKIAEVNVFLTKLKLHLLDAQYDLVLHHVENEKVPEDMENIQTHLEGFTKVNISNDAMAMCQDFSDFADHQIDAVKNHMSGEKHEELTKKAVVALAKFNKKVPSEWQFAFTDFAEEVMKELPKDAEAKTAAEATTATAPYLKQDKYAGMVDILKERGILDADGNMVKQSPDDGEELAKGQPVTSSAIKELKDNPAAVAATDDTKPVVEPTGQKNDTPKTKTITATGETVH